MSRKISGIYKISHIESGRIYIGSSVDVYRRWKEHRSNHGRQAIGYAIQKYGKESFEFTILEEVLPEKELLLEKEQYYLDLYTPFVWTGRGFNISESAYSPLGQRRSNETKQKMKESWHKNRGKEYFDALSERMSGDKNPAKRPEVRDKISKARQGQTWKDDEERVRKHKAQLKEKTIFGSPEHRALMKQVHIGAKRSEESKDRMRSWQQRTYCLTCPDNHTVILQTTEIKQFCKENNLHWSNLIGTKNSIDKKYKGYRVDELSS